MKSVSRLLFVLAIALTTSAILSPAEAQDYPRQFSIEARMVTATHRLNTCMQAVADVDDVVNFASGSSALTAEGAKQVKRLAASIKGKTHHGAHFVVQGYTDAAGNDAKNQRLSYHRALTVMHALVKEYGIAAKMLSAQGYGSADPVATNSTAEGRAANRRVTVSSVGK